MPALNQDTRAVTTTSAVALDDEIADPWKRQRLGSLSVASSLRLA